VLDRLRRAQTIVFPRTPAQREQLEEMGGFIVPHAAVDAQSLIAYADLVVSAGGTMNREAAALGTPVLTVFEGRLGGVDERLIAEGRLRRLTTPDDIELTKRAPTPSGARIRRDPQLLVNLLTSPLHAYA
jgi:predicted glycosyltransferase